MHSHFVAFDTTTKVSNWLYIVWVIQHPEKRLSREVKKLKTVTASRVPTYSEMGKCLVRERRIY